MHMPDAGPYRRDHGSVRVPGFQVSYSIVEIMMVNRKAAEKEAGRAHVQTYLGTLQT